MRGHPKPPRWKPAGLAVSSRAPVRGHHASCRWCKHVWTVSSRAPVRGHHALLSASSAHIWCFKSCPREGASATASMLYGIPLVSSRAPVRGHPPSPARAATKQGVSSRAPVRGHQIKVPGLSRSISFKSCPREGASQFRKCGCSDFVVSSRAPVRGHQYTWYPASPIGIVSSRAPVRGHPGFKKGICPIRLFQVVPP